MIREKRPANVCREAFDYWEGAPSIISRSCSNTTWHPRYGFEISEPRALLTTQPLILEVWEELHDNTVPIKVVEHFTLAKSIKHSELRKFGQDRYPAF